jgi:hypothetical protein
MRHSQALFALVAFLAPTAACVDPGGDYQSYLDRTAQYRTSGDGGGTVDSVAPTMGIKGTYYVACLPSLSFGDINKLFRFYVESEYVPVMGGTGAKVTYKLTPMNIRDASGVILPPAGLKFVKPTNPTLTVTDSPVDAKGKFVANFKTAMIGAVTNPISFRDITVDNTTLAGYFADKDFCGGLSGHVVAPIDQDLGTASDNVCLFKPMKDGDTLPDLKSTEFVCPGL